MKAVFLFPEDNELLELLSVPLSVLQEVMCEEFLGVRSFLRVLVKATRDEVLECSRPLLPLEFRSVLGDDQVEDLLLRLCDVGRLTVCKLQREDAVAPYVDLAIVLTLASDELGSHPAHCAYLARAFVVFLG